MQLIIYLGHDGDTECFHSFAQINSINLKVKQTYFGSKLVFSNDEDFKSDLISFIIEYITITYLSDYILNKIYDEYVDISLDETVMILNNVSKSLQESELRSLIDFFWSKQSVLNVSSLILFNINKIMSTVNGVVDEICITFIFQKEKEQLLEQIRVFKHISEHESINANVEFLPEDSISVVIDNEE